MNNQVNTTTPDTILKAMREAFGAPGDHGYSTKQGQALFDLYQFLANCIDYKPDAERYRYLEAEHVRFWTSNMGGPDTLDIDFEAEGHDLDAAIDAAMKGAA